MREAPSVTSRSKTTRARSGPTRAFGESWRLTPGVRYRALSRDLEFEDATTPVDLTYVTVSVGLVRIF